MPLSEAIVVAPDATDAKLMAGLTDIVSDELNVKTVSVAQKDPEQVKFQVKPNFRALGPTFGKKVKELAKLLSKADGAALRAQLAADGAVKVCEDAGLEVIVSPFTEWIKYVTHRNIEDGMRDRKIGKILRGYIRRVVLNRDEKSVVTKFGAPIGVHEPSIGQILSLSEEYLSPKCGSEAVLSIGSGIEWLHDPAFAGVISVMPHGCMPGGIVAAMADSLSAQYSKPWISVTYDGFMETNNLTKINNFAEILCATATTTAR